LRFVRVQGRCGSLSREGERTKTKTGVKQNEAGQKKVWRYTPS